MLASVILFFSCATTSEEAPGWVDSPPQDTADTYYFTGAGSSSTGDRAEAEKEAASIIVSEITKYLGVRITSDTTAEARDAYGKFESSLSATVREESSARITGLQISDRWIETSETGVTVYILAEYAAADLSAEKARLDQLFKEKQEAISGPEKEGDSLFTDKKFYRASVQYIEAALAASESDLENAALKFERNITKAREAVDRISIENISGPESVYIGGKFNDPFSVRLVSDGAPVEGLPITAVYKEMRANGRKTVKNHTVLTDSEGIASFTPPNPGWVGSEKITFFLDMRAVIEPLENVSFKLLQYVDSLEQAINSKRTFFVYEILSKAVEIPTCVMVMDVDRSGNPLNQTDTASGILSELTEAGFDVFILPVDYRMTAVSDTEMIALVREQYGNIYERFIFGTAEISSFEENGTSVIVKVAGKIKAVELESGRVLFSAAEQKRAMGSGNSSTISAAFNSLGRMYGERLITDLP